MSVNKIGPGLGEKKKKTKSPINFPIFLLPDTQIQNISFDSLSIVLCKLSLSIFSFTTLYLSFSFLLSPPELKSL